MQFILEKSHAKNEHFRKILTEREVFLAVASNLQKNLAVILCKLCLCERYNLIMMATSVIIGTV